MGVSRRVVDFIASYVRLDTLGVVGVLGDQASHFRDRLRLPLRGSYIVKSEAHPKQDRTLKSSFLIFNQRSRRVVEIPFNKISRYPLNFMAIQDHWPDFQALSDVNDGHDNGRAFVRPLIALRGAEDLALMPENGREPCRARIALSDRVRSDQPEYAIFSQKAERAAKKVCNEVRIAVCAFMQRLQPRQVPRSRAG